MVKSVCHSCAGAAISGTESMRGEVGKQLSKETPSSQARAHRLVSSLLKLPPGHHTSMYIQATASETRRNREKFIILGRRHLNAV